jgi:hypothetical protein
MPKVTILCEGHTEQKVLREFLAPYCTNLQVSVQHTGGNAKLKADYKDFAERLLKQDTSGYVICLIDVYQAPFLYPKSLATSEDAVHAQYVYIKELMESSIDEKVRNRFFAFPVVMELETWILADSVGLGRHLVTSIAAYASPENIVHPVDKLKDLYRQHLRKDYTKNVIEIQRLFKSLSSERVYQDNCPHFEELINQLYVLQNLTPPKSKLPTVSVNASLKSELEQVHEEQNEIWRIIEEAKGDWLPEEEKRLLELEQVELSLTAQIADYRTYQ